MSLLKCPKCGEMFSDSYSTCPFCAEDEEFFSGQTTKTPGRRLEKRKSPSILGPALVVVILLLLAFLVYTFFGSTIAGWFNGDSKSEDEPQSQQEEVIPDPLTLDQEAVTLTVGDTKKITAAGPAGVQWTSSDESVATVAEDGTVTAKAAGSATITAVAGEESVACTVTVKEAPKPEPEPEKKPEKKPEKEPEKTPEKEPEKDLAIGTIFGSLNKNDIGHWEFTASEGESFGMRVTGTDSGVTWSTSDSDVATVADDGTFTATGTGKAVLTAEVDGKTLKCDVFVK